MSEIREFMIKDYDGVLQLWLETEGVRVRDSDSREATGAYLARNLGLSFVAVHDDRIVGAILCGHDGRCGFIHHLVVAAGERRKGLGRALAEKSISSLLKLGISRCHIFVLRRNRSAKNFWLSLGWSVRDDVMIMTFHQT